MLLRLVISVCRPQIVWKSFLVTAQENGVFGSTINGGSALCGTTMTRMMLRSWIIINY